MLDKIDGESVDFVAENIREGVSNEFNEELEPIAFERLEETATEGGKPVTDWEAALLDIAVSVMVALSVGDRSVTTVEDVENRVAVVYDPGCDIVVRVEETKVVAVVVESDNTVALVELRDTTKAVDSVEDAAMLSDVDSTVGTEALSVVDTITLPVVNVDMLSEPAVELLSAVESVTVLPVVDVLSLTVAEVVILETTLL
ncbi:hypothetical protein BD408DRAFT_67750 [Parasitella parasitica]|nr:hypothetical protein BD408DRAFT_67750 [Parasitella parasitica]